MQYYTVFVREVHIQSVRVLAKSKQNAIELVTAGSGEYMDNQLEYSHTLDSELWTVEKTQIEIPIELKKLAEERRKAKSFDEWMSLMNAENYGTANYIESFCPVCGATLKKVAVYFDVKEHVIDISGHCDRCDRNYHRHYDLKEH